MSNWPQMPLTEAFEIISGGTPTTSKPEFWNGSIPWLSVGDFTGSNRYVDAAEKSITETGLAKSNCNKLNAGDLVVSARGTVGEIAQLSRSMAFNQSCYGLRVISSVLDQNFGYYFLLTAVSHLRQYVHGSVFSTITRRTFSEFRLPVPPLLEQRAIAEALGALDDKIASNTRLAATALDLATLIYERSTNQLSSVPMSSVLTPILGGTPPRANENYWTGEQQWVSAKDITGAEFATVIETAEKISLEAEQETKAKPLPAGSVILTARGTVGAVARLAVPASFNQSCYGFVPGPVTPGVLYFAILQSTQRAKAIAHGSVFDTITMKTFDHLEFPDFEGDAMEETEAKIAPLLDTITGSVFENQHLAATRDMLLPQLMSGKLRVKEAEALISTVI